MILYLVVLPTILLHLAFAGFRVALSLFALSLGIAPAFWAMATMLAGGGYWLRKP